MILDRQCLISSCYLEPEFNLRCENYAASTDKIHNMLFAMDKSVKQKFCLDVFKLNHI